eukprot:gene6476-9351_t
MLSFVKDTLSTILVPRAFAMEASHESKGLVTVVGIDTSEASQNAVHHTLRRSRENDTIHILYCFTPLTDFVGPEFVKSPSPEQHEQWRLKEMKNFEDCLKKVDLTTQSNIETAIVAGDPRSKIIEYAKRQNADEIVVGSHGKGFLTRSLLGSVSTYLCHNSPVPVTVVPSAKKHEK